MNIVRRSILFHGLKSRANSEMQACLNTRCSEEGAHYINLPAERRFKVFHYFPEKPSRPVGIVYVPGFRSTSRGNKARRLLEHCQESQLEFVRYDPEGLGDSPHNPRELEFAHWIDNAESAMNCIKSERVVLVGSSLGGLISLKLALKHPGRVSALFLICPALSTLSKSYQRWRETQSKESLDKIDSGEVFTFKGDGMPPLSTTKRLLETQAMEDIDAASPVNVSCPMVILHGMQDESVPPDTSFALAENVLSPKVDLVLRKDGDHRLSREEDLSLMMGCLDRLINSL